MFLLLVFLFETESRPDFVLEILIETDLDSIDFDDIEGSFSS
jgi:hypothetical protein